MSGDFRALRLIGSVDNWSVLAAQRKGRQMRKPRDFDAELKALDEVIATGADELPVEELAGALLSAAGSDDRAAKEAWRTSGAAFFQRPARMPARSVDRGASSGKTNGGGAKSAAGETGAA
jgi:hypothetical protein